LNVTVQPSGVVLEVQPGECILDAARRLGLECPQSCRNGNCHICAATLLRGRVRQRDAELTAGEVLPCVAVPLADCELLWPLLLAPGTLPVREMSCQLIACEPLGGDVYRLRLRAPAGKPPRYHAGQYVMLQREDGDWSAYSLASAPHQGRELELHILARDEQPRALLTFIERSGVARVQLPFGDACLERLPEGPLLLIAAGTGLAQMCGLIEHCCASGFAHPLHLYWGVRSPEDFYALPQWDEWQRTPNLILHRVVSDLCGWEGRCGLLHEAVRADFPSLSGLHVYASGSPAMVYATLDALVEAGMAPQQMHADVFAYAPRPA